MQLRTSVPIIRNLPRHHYRQRLRLNTTTGLLGLLIHWMPTTSHLSWILFSSFGFVRGVAQSRRCPSATGRDYLWCRAQIGSLHCSPSIVTRYIVANSIGVQVGSHLLTGKGMISIKKCCIYGVFNVYLGSGRSFDCHPMESLDSTHVNRSL